MNAWTRKMVVLAWFSSGVLLVGGCGALIGNLAVGLATDAIVQAIIGAGT